MNDRAESVISISHIFIRVLYAFTLRTIICINKNNNNNNNNISYNNIPKAERPSINAMTDVEDPSFVTILTASEYLYCWRERKPGDKV